MANVLSFLMSLTVRDESSKPPEALLPTGIDGTFLQIGSSDTVYLCVGHGCETPDGDPRPSR